MMCKMARAVTHSADPDRTYLTDSLIVYTLRANTSFCLNILGSVGFIIIGRSAQLSANPCEYDFQFNCLVKDFQQSYFPASFQYIS